MKTEQTTDRFMSIVGHANSSVKVEYHETATEAVIAAGCPKWNCLFQSKAAYALEPGDELSVNGTGSVIRITGKDVDFQS